MAVLTEENTVAKLPDIVTSRDIASRMDYAESYVRSMLAAGHMPEPDGRIGGANVWLWSSIVTWAHETGRGERIGGDHD